MTAIGKILALTGLILLIVGLILWIGGDRLGWFGNLPGDFRIEGKGFSVYFPLTSMVIISLAMSFLLWVIRRLFM
jgi:hypothetical protein